jgi:hypothetical protein
MWSHLRKKMAPHWQADRHEDKLNLGVADVSFAMNGCWHGWMELKHIHEWPKRASTVVRIDHFTHEQRLWLRLKGEAAGNTWLLLNVGDARGEWLLFNWRKLPLVGVVTRSELYDHCVLQMKGFVTDNFKNVLWRDCDA